MPLKELAKAAVKSLKKPPPTKLDDAVNAIRDRDGMWVQEQYRSRGAELTDKVKPLGDNPFRHEIYGRNITERAKKEMLETAQHADDVRFNRVGRDASSDVGKGVEKSRNIAVPVVIVAAAAPASTQSKAKAKDTDADKFKKAFNEK